ncbi:unnamed protein product [Polarella glacialis]|uniref:Amine oxidase n=1 Tax=Polarella glacialis TaxID=89957 RepID=A0A813JVX8_POLGL|nr:unnamed protein product [Polarella glacialis]
MAARFAQRRALLGCFFLFCSLLTVGQELRGSEEQATTTATTEAEAAATTTTTTTRIVCDKMLAMRYDTVPNSVPTAWQLGNCRQRVAAGPHYDLAVVGAGIGGAYIIDQLRGDTQHTQKIALFEWGEHAGGRLQSSYGAGQLGLLAKPYDEQRALAPPEYGGMRIDPMKYPLVWAAVERQYHALHGDEGCCKLGCCIADPKVCCPKFLVQMDVGNVHYHTSKEETGARLSNSKITDPNPLYLDHEAKYSAGDIDSFEIFTPFVQCVLLGLGAEYYYANVAKKEPPFPAEKAFSEACARPACTEFEEKFDFA